MFGKGSFYRVIIRGENAEIELDGTKQRMGFYVERVVSAKTADDAEVQARMEVAAEVATKVVPGSSAPALECEEVQRIDERPPRVKPGFAWYPSGLH